MSVPADIVFGMRFGIGGVTARGRRLVNGWLRGLASRSLGWLGESRASASTRPRPRSGDTTPDEAWRGEEPKASAAPRARRRHRGLMRADPWAVLGPDDSPRAPRPGFAAIGRAPPASGAGLVRGSARLGSVLVVALFQLVVDAHRRLLGRGRAEARLGPELVSDPRLEQFAARVQLVRLAMPEVAIAIDGQASRRASTGSP